MVSTATARATLVDDTEDEIVIYLDLRRIGEVFSQTFEMRSRETAAREPDLVVLLDVHRDRLENVRIRGAADLAVEIVSPDSVTRDRRVKLAEYAAAGVPDRGRDGSGSRCSSSTRAASTRRSSRTRTAVCARRCCRGSGSTPRG